MATFNATSIFGACLKVVGPTIGAYRHQREMLPGVSGCRIYRIGDATRTWAIRGRLVAASVALLDTAVQAGQTYMDGNLYTFVDPGGTSHGSCMLQSFQPQGGYALTSEGYTVEISAVVEQVSP